MIGSRRGPGRRVLPVSSYRRRLYSQVSAVGLTTAEVHSVAPVGGVLRGVHLLPLVVVAVVLVRGRHGAGRDSLDELPVRLAPVGRDRVDARPHLHVVAARVVDRSQPRAAADRQEVIDHVLDVHDLLAAGGGDGIAGGAGVVRCRLAERQRDARPGIGAGVDPQIGPPDRLLQTGGVGGGENPAVTVERPVGLRHSGRGSHDGDHDTAHRCCQKTSTTTCTASAWT